MTLPRTWHAVYEHVNGRLFLGEPLVRDPNAICDAFDPVPNADWLGLELRAAGNGNCGTDGHYLCLSCTHISKEAVEERTQRSEISISSLYHPPESS